MYNIDIQSNSLRMVLTPDFKHLLKQASREISQTLLAKQMSRITTKPTKWHVRPAKTQISLGICPVWSEYSLSALRKLGSLATHWANSEDSDQTGQMPRLIWVFICHFVGFVMRRLKCIRYDFVVLSQCIVRKYDDMKDAWERCSQARHY